jgi:hypothetical protein
MTGCLGACTVNTTTGCAGGNYCTTGTACAAQKANGSPCSVTAECTSGICYGTPSKTCQADLCSDGTKDGTETDIDCGGATCVADGKKCAYNKGCAIAADCVSGVCISGGNLCGCTTGGDCPANYDCKTSTNICLLVTGQPCAVPTDCVSGVCNVPDGGTSGLCG